MKNHNLSRLVKLDVHRILYIFLSQMHFCTEFLSSWLFINLHLLDYLYGVSQYKLLAEHPVMSAQYVLKRLCTFKCTITHTLLARNRAIVR